VRFVMRREETNSLRVQGARHESEYERPANLVLYEERHREM